MIKFSTKPSIATQICAYSFHFTFLFWIEFMRFYYNCQHLCCFLLSECLAVCDIKPFYRWNAVFFILSTTKTISNRLEAVLVAHGNFVQLCSVGYPPSSSVNSSTTQRKRGYVLFFKRWAWKTLIVKVIEWSSMEWFLATKNSFKAMTPHHVDCKIMQIY